MGKLMIVNASPRAPKSNSKKYIELFLSYWKEDVAIEQAFSIDLRAAFTKLDACDHLLLVFPLYADGLPVTLMRFLKELEQYPQKPTVHLIVNCGFLEAEQNLVAVDMIRIFCKQNGCPFGSALCIGSGEAILTTPFAFFVKRNLKKLARAIRQNRAALYKVTMPIPKRTFVKASEKYWLQYGAKYGNSREQMDTMEIEGRAQSK